MDKDINVPKAYAIVTAVALFVLSFGAVFYHYVEKLDWLDAFYFCVVSLTTVGYGDISPKTDAGKLFTMFYLLIGIGIITAFITTSVKIRAAKLEARRAKRRANLK